MNLVPPEPGSVIRYSYLSADEHSRNREEGRKDRPAVVLAIAVHTQDGHTKVFILPVTHTPSAAPSDAITIPLQVKRRLKLDQDASWIVTTEANAFIWPGPDIRPVPNRDPATVIYGKIPSDLLQSVARSFLANRKRQQARVVPRSR